MMVMLDAEAEAESAGTVSGCTATAMDGTESVGTTDANTGEAAVLKAVPVVLVTTRRLAGAFSRAELRLVCGLIDVMKMMWIY